jgi:hypothetical protein
VKRAVFLIALLCLGVALGVFWLKKRNTAPPAVEEKEPSEGARITHDAQGHVVIKMDDETQGNMGLVVAKPEAAQLKPEIKGYGRVMEPMALAALITELAAAQAAYAASSNELVRLRTLATQGNASERALQTAEAAALRDSLAVQSDKDRLVLAWGRAVAEQTNLLAFVQLLATQNSALVRIDLPVGDKLTGPPEGGRLETLGGDCAEAEFLGVTTSVDPQTLSQGYLFLLKPNSLHLKSGEAVTGYVEVGGELLSGALIPREAVVRTEGAGWVYRLNEGGEAFTRVEIPMDHSAKDGWVVTRNVSTNDYIVVTGAQTLLSEELKASLKPD